MRLLLLLSFISLTLATCDNPKKSKQRQSFNSFDFSYNDVFSTCFSIKFTSGDTVFIRQHFASFFSDTPKSNTTYYALLTQTDKAKFDSFISQIKFANFDTSYYQSYEDEIDYQFYFDSDTTRKMIRIHSDSIPKELSEFKNWIVNTKEALQLHRIDTVINFESTRFFLPPNVPSPSIKFKPPKVE